MQHHYQTRGTLDVTSNKTAIAYEKAIEVLINKLDTERGAIYSSGYEFPGRYTRWDVGFVNPPIVLTCSMNHFVFDALNQRGSVLLAFIAQHVKKHDLIESFEETNTKLEGKIKLSTASLAEEMRSKKPSIFTIIRIILDIFSTKEDEHLGLYGAFAYDLVFQFEQLNKKMTRQDEQRDLVLYLPDQIYTIDHDRRIAEIHEYEFRFENQSTEQLPREGAVDAYEPKHTPDRFCDHDPGEYANLVLEAKKKFKRGDLFEVVLSQTFFERCGVNPSEIFRRLIKTNPAPYQFFINLGHKEYLVGASPEIYLRVKDKQIETCPISGTIQRGLDAIGDANNILALLNSAKDESELTMCTDVDRNDKARICKPGSVKVIGRRQIELYSRLIHTVDHVVGELEDHFDAIDAFLSHMWVVTVTGAPKLWAMQFIEDHEKSPRRWYGGSIGWLGFNGNLNTGLTLRTIRIKEGIAEVRVGATLLYDSDPIAEEEETRLKASAFIAALNTPSVKMQVFKPDFIKPSGLNKTIFLVDHQDSFVHNLSNYFRQTGATVTTWRYDFPEQALLDSKANLMVLSPGPGNPKDFDTRKTIDLALKHQLPIFGVCLGLQAIVEYFGGELLTLDYPMHGKQSEIKIMDSMLFKDMPETISVGRYHSLHANPINLPDCLKVTAQTEDGVIMAIEHKTLPISAVQFHPESIMSFANMSGLKIIFNLIGALK